LDSLEDEPKLPGSGDIKAIDVTGSFDPTSYNKTGWMTLYVNGQVSATINSTSVARSAGYFEGHITAEYIRMQYLNLFVPECKEAPDACTKTQTFLSENTEWVTQQFAAQLNQSYWFQTSLFYEQMEGLKEGYQASGQPALPDIAFTAMQFGGDMETLMQAFSVEKLPRIVGAGSCSALVRLTAKNEDIYFTHDTWSSFTTMLKIYKRYDLPYAMSSTDSTTIPGSQLSFSSYPGYLLSTEDFYVVHGSGLAVMETTNGYMKSDLESLISSKSVLESVRNMIANRLAPNALDWCEIFKEYNSGTYNNQWMVLDYNRFTPGVPHLRPGTFYVLEQMPGKVEYKDMSARLQQEKYWASYNIPYFPDIYEQSGFPEMAQKYGPFFTHDGSPRGRIFARDVAKAVDKDSVIHLMRYNDFMHDPLSACECTPPYSGENGISARSDLNPANGTYPFGALGHRCHGGTDNKLVNYELFTKSTVTATCGPTHQGLPPFQWSKTEWTRPLGHPDVFMFDPVDLTLP
jgi:hypothetical protein